MTEPKSAFREARADVSFLRWIFGWHPVVGWAMVIFLLGGIGYYFRAAYLFGLIGLIIGGPIWYQGTKYIDRHADSIREGYMTDVEEFGPVVLEAAGMADDAEVFVLTKTPEDTQPFVEAPTQVDVTLVGVGEETVWIYDETTLDLMFLKAGVGTDPEQVKRFSYPELDEVAFEDGELVLRPVEETEDLATYRTPLSFEPRELISTIRERTETSH